jgi:tripartite-type tricarboxylate transporter receptor subunit TctC
MAVVVPASFHCRLAGVQNLRPKTVAFRGEVRHAFSVEQHETIAHDAIIAGRIEESSGNMKRRTWFVAGALLAAVNMGYAQRYPAKSIRFVVPFAPGGGTDFLARLIALHLSEALGQPVLIDNRPGAGGAVGADLVAKSPADGYTIMLASPGSLSINPHMAKTPYDPLRDFAPVSLATVSPFAMSANLSVPANSVKELIALATAKPGTLNFGSSGSGSTGHIAGEQLKMLTGINMVHVAFKGSSGVSTALLSGEIQLGFENLPVVLALARAGKLKLLGVASLQRSPLAPDVPTVAEGGVPGYETITAFGVAAPAKTPPTAVDVLNREIGRAHV